MFEGYLLAVLITKFFQILQILTTNIIMIRNQLVKIFDQIIEPFVFYNIFDFGNDKIAGNDIISIFKSVRNLREHVLVVNSGLP